MHNVLKNKTLKNGGLYLFGNFFNKAISFIMVPIFTRIMTTTEYGITSTYFSWVSILSVIIGLSLGNSIRNAFVDYKDDLKGYLSSIFTLSFLNFIILFVIIVGINFKFNFVEMPLVIMCLIQSFATFVINAIIVKYMMEEESFKRTIMLVIPNLFAAILSIVLIFNMESNREYGRIVGMFSTTAIFGALVFCTVIVKGGKIVNLEYWKYALSISVPLIFHGLSVNILSSSDRTIITALRSASETGMYSVVYNFGMIAIVITSSLENVWIPYFTRKMIENDKESINCSAKLYIELCTVVFGGLLIISPEILIWLASDKYADGTGIIAPIILASFLQFLYSLAVDTEYYYKKTKIIASNTVVAALTNLILNFMFIPMGGAFAASFTTVAAYFISFFIHYRYCKKIDKNLFPLPTFAVPIIYIILITLFHYLTLNNVILRWGIGIGMIALYSVVIIIKNKEILKRILNN